MYQQNGSHKPVNNHIDRRHERTITVGINTVELYYPGTTEDRYFENGQSTTYEKRIVGAPPTGWESDLVTSIQGLRRPEKIGDIYPLLPSGSCVIYKTYTSEQDRIPKVIEIAEEVVGENLDNVVTIVELWLKKKLDS
ncbi:MAG: hypothetical protein IH934_07220 [Nanoarchaeota archaeon]|nr:hypothetical protein [Nanoarchaeota archaeon]